MRYAIALFVMLGLCGCKATNASKSAPGAECGAEVAALETWLSAVAAEGITSADMFPGPDGYHLRDRALPAMALATVDERPAPPPPIAIVALENARARFGDAVAPASEAPRLDDLMKRVSASGLAQGIRTGRHGGSHFSMPLVIFIAAEEKWSNVVALVDAATRGGVTHVFFTFAAKSGVSPLGDGPSAKRIVAVASDPDEMPWKRDVAAVAELARANPSCPAVARAFATEANDTIATNAQLDDFIAHAARDVAACQCHADIEAVKAVAWTRFGRHWGAPIKAYKLDVVGQRGPIKGNPPASDELALPPDAVWREVAPRLVALSQRKAIVSFVAR